MNFLKLLPMLLWILPTLTYCETVNLIDIPMNDGSDFSYIIEQPKKCSFDGVTSVKTPDLKEAAKKKAVADKISYIQKKINLEIEKTEISSERITFSLKGAENMYFEFYYKKDEGCKLTKVIHYNKKALELKEIEIDYNTFLKSPVLEKIIIKSDEPEKNDVNLYPWALRGQLSLYEFSLGPALNIHSNIRVNDQNNFNKNNPVIEPIPAFFFRYGPVFVNKNGLGSLLYNNGYFTILGMGILEGEPYKTPGLRERSQGVFFGTIFKYNLVELTYYNDFFKNKGFNVKLNLAPEFYAGISWKFSPQVFLQYWDNKYVNYYFGVKNEEVSPSGFKYYEGTNTLNYGTMFETIHYHGKWTFVGNVGVKFYGNEVSNSPTVVRDKEVRFITSVLYKFF
ncbi:MAG: MipA/OmpV family protein [Bacteriovorax sp.]|nr:MipA/OmpV family protein [Bacteriovorax sp.]